MRSEVAWHHEQTLAAGQVVEFKVWAELVRQSGGDLHVFLPLRDRGIDGVLHRLSDGAYIALQVKGRTSLTPAGQVHVTVTATSLVDEEALMVVALVDGPELGPFVLVITEADFRRLAAHDWVEGREYLTAAFEPRIDSGSRWAPFLVSRERLAERFVAAGRGTGTGTGRAAAAPSTVDRAAEGFVGEAEVIRRLAGAEPLALFRPFPDLETVEVLARHVGTRRYAGLQVKTAGFDPAHEEERVYFRRASFRPAPSTLVCVLGWDRVARRFADACLLIPAADIASLARAEGEWLVLELEPASVSHRRLERYRNRAGAVGRRSRREIVRLRQLELTN